MRNVSTLPPAFDRFREIGGVLIFSVYEAAEGDDAATLSAISSAMPDLNAAKLKEIGCSNIDKATFLGDLWDSESGALVKLGRHVTSDGRELVNPRLTELDGIHIVSGTSRLPEPFGGGQFAYAFSETPYGLRAKPSEIQELFDEITNFILPPNLEHQILDWSGPQLPEASEFFTAGMEWWGVFLFTIYVPAIKRMTVIAASATD